MIPDERQILREFKELEGRANAEILSKKLPFSIGYIQHLLRNLHEARYLKVDTLARYPMYQLTRSVKRRLKL